jgi:hypothetical protein
MAAKAPKPEKPKPIEIVSVKRTRKTIEIAWRQGDADFDLSERDNPLASFIKSLDALAPLVPVICHFPAQYAATGLRVVGFKMGEKGGAETVALSCRKDIDDVNKEFSFKTPERLLSHPTQEGKYTPALDDKAAGLVFEAIEEAKRYVRGERAQGQIAFKDDDDDRSDDDPKQITFPPLTEQEAAKVSAKK